jgi:subtilisin family serine protease
LGIPNDPYFQFQVALHNTGQTFNGHTGTPDADIDAPEAWDITHGSSNIVIAVLDQGVTSNHPDLPNTRQVRLNGSNFGSGNPNDPSPVGNDNHGNACAGIIGATMNNNQGIAGIAPNCRIMPLKIMDATPDREADAIEFAVDNGAHIISNSWSYSTSSTNLYPAIVTAIQYAINNGVVVLFSAGNTADQVQGDAGYVKFPANANVNFLRVQIKLSHRLSSIFYISISKEVNDLSPLFIHGNHP